VRGRRESAAASGDGFFRRGASISTAVSRSSRKPLDPLQRGREGSAASSRSRRKSRPPFVPAIRATVSGYGQARTTSTRFRGGSSLAAIAPVENVAPTNSASVASRGPGEEVAAIRPLSQPEEAP